MVMKTKKTKKSKGQRGNTTYGHGARKKWMGSGGHGGKGMSGTGKRADHKKSLVIKLYGNDYFGKQGITCRSTQRKKAKEINLREIQQNLESLMKKFGKGTILVLKKYKILGDGELSSKLEIKAKAFTASAKEKIEAAGGKAIVIEEKKKITENKENHESKEAPKKEKAVAKKK